MIKEYHNSTVIVGDRGSESRMQLSRKKILDHERYSNFYLFPQTNKQNKFYFQTRKSPMQQLVIYKLICTEEFLLILSNRNNGS